MAIYSHNFSWFFRSYFSFCFPLFLLTANTGNIPPVHTCWRVTVSGSYLGTNGCCCLVSVILTQLPQTSSNTIENISGKEGDGEGRCELLSCLPHPASLVPYRGAQLFVVKTGDSPRPPPAFKPSLGELWELFLGILLFLFLRFLVLSTGSNSRVK